MGEAFGDPEHFKLAIGGPGAEVEAGPLAKGGGVATEIQRDIPDVAVEDADELTLRQAELVMEAAENAVGGAGLVVLNEGGGETGAVEGVGVEDLGEPAAVVSVLSGLDELDVLEFGFEDLHWYLGDEESRAVA